MVKVNSNAPLTTECQKSIAFHFMLNRTLVFPLVQLGLSILFFGAAGTTASEQSDAKPNARVQRQQAAEEQRAARRKAELEKKQAEEARKQQEERERIIKKYAKFSTSELRIKIASMTQQISAGYSGQGIIGNMIAKSAWESKIKERDEMAMEIVRREEAEVSHRTGSADSLTTLSASGTGFLITEEGYLITNNHVVKGGHVIKVRTAQGDLPAKVVTTDDATDLALLKVDGHFAALPIKSSRSVRLGETVATIGFPNPTLQGFSPKLTKGEISSLAGLKDDPKHFQVSLPLQPGNSGGPLVDVSGNVIGVVVAKLSQKAALATTGTLAENVNYALKSSFLLSFLESASGVAEKLKDPLTEKRPFEDIVADVKKATALVLVY